VRPSGEDVRDGCGAGGAGKEKKERGKFPRVGFADGEGEKGSASQVGGVASQPEEGDYLRPRPSLAWLSLSSVVCLGEKEWER